MNTTTEWHKSSYSANGGNCVEVREHGAGSDVRDTQNRAAGHLTFVSGEWVALLRGVRSESC
ncbi:DUF397 domain-containing protein [Nocardiopsis halotolerans]|uniref:DUF397 domain-containing protein n=1 Tax=Nocardiopsis halotolerans TaxID=124252 RepID=UPI00034D6D83|nr:DUF397 domain-containing protein [Nocardiopsis halotolerans]